MKKQLLIATLIILVVQSALTKLEIDRINVIISTMNANILNNSYLLESKKNDVILVSAFLIISAIRPQ